MATTEMDDHNTHQPPPTKNQRKARLAQSSYRPWTGTPLTGKIAHAVVLILILAHIWIAPFTKVEESFNLQATHDILTMGVGAESVEQYDHLAFPGVVPRTFVGPLVLAMGSWPILTLIRFFAPALDVPKGILSQVVVRSVLGGFTFLGWYQFSRGIRHQFGSTVSQLFMVVSSCQFHWLFYAGRTLPNTFALVLVNVAYSYWMQASSPSSRSITKRETGQRLMRMIDCLVVSTVLFRSEVLILMGPIVLLELSVGRIGFWKTILEGFKAGVASVALAVAVDSWFWREWIWAEGAVFWFNVVEGKSVAWGVSPWHTYLTTLVPKIAMLSLPLSLMAVVMEPRFRRYILACSVFVGLYSFLEHKEWRFVIYVVPVLNLGAALAISWLMKRKTLLCRLATVVVFTGLMLSFFVSTAQSLISSLNYPGGQALQRLHELELDHYVGAKVHMDGYAAETGCSRFGEIGTNAKAGWTYSKDENHETFYDYWQYTHLITSDTDMHQMGFEILEEVDGYAGLAVQDWRTIVKDTCPWAIRRVFAQDGWSLSTLLEDIKDKAEGLWYGCSPVLVEMEPQLWIMKRTELQ